MLRLSSDIKNYYLIGVREHGYGSINKNLKSDINLALPFQKESFDGIYHLGVLEHFNVDEIQECLLEFKRVLKQDGTMIVFWPPSFGLSVKFLGLSHFILNRLFKMKVKLHPDEITLLKSKRQAASIMSKAGFKIENYYFGIQDFFTYCMIVVTKDPNSTTG